MSDIESTAPVAPAPVAAPVATPEAPTTAVEPVAPEGESPETTPRTFTQDELNKIVQKEKFKESRRAEKLAEARLRAEFAERERDALAARLNPPTPQPSGEPQPTQFQDYESYNKALIEFRIKEELGRVRKESEGQQRQREMEQLATTQMPKLDRGREKYEDFDDVVREFAAVTPPAAQDALLDSPITDDLLYYLGQNPAERDRIFRLSHVGQVKAITALEAKLTAVPTPTRTPAPIVPNSAKSPSAKPLHEQTYDEFVASREKRTKAQRKR